MTPQAKVTIGVPVRNGEQYIEKALDGLLQQARPDWEIVICDNGSQDRTAEICRAYLREHIVIRYIRSQHVVGPAGNFWRVLSYARGEYFIWAAVDDTRPPDAIAALVDALDTNPTAVMAHGPVIADRVRDGTVVRVDHRMDLSGSDAVRRVRTYTSQMQYNGMLYGLYRREALQRAVFKQHPGYDYLMGLQMCLLGPVAYTPTPMLIYRHVWGETDNPMYRLEPITARDLLLYQGVRRWKCWISLILGACFLLRMRGVTHLDRVKGAAAHIKGFGVRFRSHLLTELVFLAFTPFMWAFAPFAPAARRLKRALLVHG